MQKVFLPLLPGVFNSLSLAFSPALVLYLRFALYLPNPFPGRAYLTDVNQQLTRPKPAAKSIFSTLSTTTTTTTICINQVVWKKCGLIFFRVPFSLPSLAFTKNPLFRLFAIPSLLLHVLAALVAIHVTYECNKKNTHTSTVTMLKCNEQQNKRNRNHRKLLLLLFDFPVPRI